MNKLHKLVIIEKELFIYGLIGSLCASIDFILFTILNIQLNIGYVFANIISVNCGIISSFFLNRYFTFKIKDKIVVRFLSFYLIGLIGLLISSVLLMTLIELFLWNQIISKGVTLVIVALVQFTMNKLITFKIK